MAETRMKNILKSRIFLLAFINVSIFCFLALATNGKFLNWTNIKAIISLMTYDLLIASGMTFVLILGGIDLSVGAQVALESVVIALLLRSGYPLGAALGAGFTVAVIVGFCNGYLVDRFSLAPFLVTLGAQLICRGIATVATQGQYISFPKASKAFLSFGRYEIMVAGKYGFSLILLISIVLILVFAFFLKNWNPLNRAFLIGANPRAARLSGMNVSRMTVLAYIVCAMFSFLAAVFMTANNRIGYANYGISYEMNAIAVSVVGGASMTGGRGNLLGSLLGVLMLALITNGFVMLGGSPNWQQAATGFVLIAALVFDAITNRGIKGV
ncbi:MAG: ABC transporter permease [Synergistaceae bacterium]|jgi:ribose transport system permease protein|nr:ABC transporter permease [Synergistaceae bacterium]